ncbi:MAG: hypothetical protein SP4CHLAM5_08290 [Chlamydiia bacterium]|nr:hypothetical protein [Chlamydiia bacterium]MCH9618692.1 hypothetical protein [Chlamydiia bacterium]MCH9624405.1 hypothetical protein [Chlamydiia bacterium]
MVKPYLNNIYYNETIDYNEAMERQRDNYNALVINGAKNRMSMLIPAITCLGVAAGIYIAQTYFITTENEHVQWYLSKASTFLTLIGAALFCIEFNHVNHLATSALEMLKSYKEECEGLHLLSADLVNECNSVKKD